MKITRVLLKNEYPKLVGTELETVYPNLPEGSKVLVVEDEETEKILGTWALIPYYHAECVWIHPNYEGNAGIARRLLLGMYELMKGAGVNAVLTASMSNRVTRILKKLGAVKLPGEHYALGRRR